MFSILLVDADEHSREALRRALCVLPCTLVLATCAEQALSKAHALNFNLLISAYRLPEMNGIALSKALKSTQPSLQAIMLSGFADLREIKQAAGGMQLHRCLTKPWSTAQLMAAVQPLISACEPLAKPLASADKQVPEQGALAALERKYPGITQLKSGWSPTGG